MLSLNAPLSERIAYCFSQVPQPEIVEALVASEEISGFFDNNGFRDADDAQVYIDAAEAVQKALDAHYIDGAEELVHTLERAKRLAKIAEELNNMRTNPATHDDDIAEAFGELADFFKGE